MSEETTDTPEVTPSDATAFLIIKRQDGSFYATTNLGYSLKVERAATRQDVKHGCRDILDILNYSDEANVTAEAVFKLLQPKQEETVSGSIREALDERGIL